MTATAWIFTGACVAGLVALNRFLRAREEDGSFDAGPSSASRPGLRRFFDFGPKGWSEDGINQRPTTSH
jgi:hypothetical protein